MKKGTLDNEYYFYEDGRILHCYDRTQNKLNIEEMARMTSTSKYHFIRCFKKEIGLTPHQFQMQNRVRKAQKLLSQTDSMTKVAMDTGFCDQSHFIKQFEKIVGLTPSDYKRAFSIL